MADYYYHVDINGKVTKKKKPSYHVDINGNVTALTEQETSQKSTWFQKGALEGGVTAGNVAKAALGTGRDVGENLTKGAVGIFETASDAIISIGGKILSTLMKPALGDMKFIHDGRVKSAETAISDYVAEDVIDEEKVAKTILLSDTYQQITGIDPEKDSVLGEKSDALVQSAGQLAATMGLQMVGVPWWLTSGATAYGGELENALNQGATLDEASLSAAITAGAEILTEKLGGINFGSGAVDDLLVKQIAMGVSSKIARTGLALGVKATGEGLEEWVSNAISELGQSLTYADATTWKELLFDEEAADSFIGGFLLSGGSSSVEAVQAANAGKDYASGLTKNEQAVVDKVYKDRVAQEEKSGKVTQSRKSKIYDQVLSDMAKGRISTDTIEEILGKDELSRYDALSKEAEEFKTLYETEGGKLSEKQKDRLAELKAKNQANAYEGLLKTERARISQNVADMVKADRLSESYNEQSRKSQKFEADVNRYDTKQRQTIQNAIDSGILNNTNRTHEFVDLIARISADKGVAFDFADNAKLKETGFALDGVTVNGFVNENGVTVNVNSAKALNSVVGHEITHVLEGTELYDTLAQTITEYAKSKGEYDSRLEQLTSLYEGRNANVEQEVVADLVGDYLFTDTDFVNRLSTEHRNVFEKIFDEIKYLCKVATAGSKEARQLEKVKKAFEEAYRTETKNPTTEGGIKYSLNKDAKTELHKALYDKNYQGEVLLRDESPAIMLAQKGVKNLPMSMKASHIRENVFTEAEAKSLGLRVDRHTHYHGLTEEFFLKIIDGLDNVKEAYRGTKNADDPTRGEKYFLLVSEFTDKDGNTINVPVYIDEHALFNRAFIDVNKISTAFGRENFRDYINRQIRDHNLVRIKNRSIQTSESNALIARDYGENASNDSIRNENGNVNTKNSLSNQQADDLFPLPGNTYGKDITLEFPLPPGYTERANAATPQNKGTTLEFPLPPGHEEKRQAANGARNDLSSDESNAESRRRLTDDDLFDYMRVGERKHVRDAKQHIVDSGESPILTKPSEIFSFIRNALRGKVKNVVKAYGRVNDRLANAVKDATNGEVNIDDYYLELDANRIAHLDDHVDHDKDVRNIPLTEEQAEQIPEYVDNFDDLINVIRRKDGSVRLMLGKKINGHTIIVETVSKGRSSLHPVTAYQIDTNDYINNYKTRAIGRSSTSRSANADTVDISRPAIAPVNSIPKEGPVVNQETVGAAPSGFDPVSHLQYEYGSLPEGENAVREDSLPKSITGKDRVSLTARTVKGAEATPDEFVDLLDRETVEGELSYLSIKNDATVKAAYEAIVREGWEAAKYKWEADVRAGKVSAELSATGALLLNNAAKVGDKKAWMDILHDYQIMGTNAGQAVQALRILKTLSPDDSLYMIKRSISQMVKDMKLGTDIQIDEALQQRYRDAKTDAEREATRKEIAAQVARQIPSTAMDKWTALRYLNMLGNVRTQGRNFFGNAGMALVSKVKNDIATALEGIAYRVSGGKTQRTKAFSVNKELLAAAKKDFANMEGMALGGGKFSDSVAQSLQFKQEVQDARRIFKNPLLERYRRATNWAMDKGDLVFSRAAYARSLAGYLTAQGIKETDFSKIDPQILDEARGYAVRQAQEQTFRDSNWLSDWVSKMGRRNDTPGVGKLLSEGVMPFRKTPANILIRAEEYSPLGLVNATVKSIQAAKGKGGVTGAEAVNSWAKALTGTGLFGLGMLLSSLGVLSGSPDEDNDKEWFEDQYGWQNYALHFGDVNFTIDFLSPEAMPLLMGAQMMELMQDGGIELKEIESALLSIADPMIEMSMLQGVNDTLDNIRYAESNMGQFLVNAGVSYLTQGLTNSLMGQLERSFEGQRMSTYVDKDSSLPDWLQKALGKASAKTPGLDYNQIPYINAWGEEETSNPLFAFLENAMSPAYVEQGRTDAVYTELNRLNDAQSDTNVYPQTPDKTLTFDDADGVRHENYNLSADEYVLLAKLQGQTQKKLVEDIISSDLYNELTDQEKAKAIQLAYTYSKEYSRQKVLNSDGFSAEWMGEVSGSLVEAIISHTSEERTFSYKYPGKYALSQAVGGYDGYKVYRQALNAIEGENRKAKVVEHINSLDAEYGEKIILYVSEFNSKESRDMYGYEIVDYLNSRSDISYSQMEAILIELGFKVSADGRITW